MWCLSLHLCFIIIFVFFFVSRRPCIVSRGWSPAPHRGGPRSIVGPYIENRGGRVAEYSRSLPVLLCHYHSTNMPYSLHFKTSIFRRKGGRNLRIFKWKIPGSTGRKNTFIFFVCPLIRSEWIMRPHFTVWPPARRRAVLWVLASVVYFRTEMQRELTLQDILDFLKRAKWKMCHRKKWAIT
jgi:hypothetical protein